MYTESNMDCCENLVKQIKPILFDQHPQVQGAVIADLFAVYLASHQGPDAEEVREALRERWLEMVDGLLLLYDEQVKKILKKNRQKN